MKDDRLYLWLRAARDITFTDDHHELEQVNLAIYPPEGDKPDQILANKAIYDPTNSVITFMGNVKIETKDALKVNTESIAYDQNRKWRKPMRRFLLNVKMFPVIPPARWFSRRVKSWS